MSFMENMLSMETRLKAMEAKFAELGYNQQRLVETSVKRQYKVEQQPQTLWAPIVAYVVDTIDPLKLNRIRFYSPFLHEPESKISELPFARAVSPFGGHDDCGVTWVPPAGSMVLIVHENGDRKSPLYLGTTFPSNRGADGNGFPYPIQEYQKLYCDRGEGYLVGETDGSQVYPPWNTENYNGYDIESEMQFENDPEAQKKITYPNIYGFKTPGKHYQKYVDGDSRCQNRWKRMEWGSAMGNWMCFKDDYLHPGGQWANPKCGPSGTLDDECLNVSALLDETVSGKEDADGNFIGPQPGDCINNSKGNDRRLAPSDQPQCANPYFKRLDECRPYKGAPTPQANAMRLPQSGIQQQSRSGQQFVMDDSVNMPKGKKLRWQDDFNFGHDNIFKGKMFMKSATGHMVELNDKEDEAELRGTENGIRMISAAGHRFTMIDHTLQGNIAGAKREIVLQSSSKHMLVMHDETNDQTIPPRREGGVPTNKSKRAWVMLRSGYGLLMKMDDAFSQEETQTQSITLLAPLLGGGEGGVAAGGRAAEAGAPTSDSCEQGHLFRMQLKGDDPKKGFILTSSGGYYICASINHHITEVGREECEAHKVNMVFGHYVTVCKKVHITKSSLELHIADRYIILGAGKDCPPPPEDEEAAASAASDALAAAQAATASATQDEPEENENSPCFFPVIVAKCPRKCPFTGWIHWTHKSMSDRVFASASPCK